MELDIVKEIINIFFDKLKVDIINIEVFLENENIYTLKIKTNDSSLLIGQGGKNLEDLRIILKSILNKIIGKNFTFKIEVNDYSSKKDDRLYHLVNSKIDICKKTGKDIVMPYLNGYDRKKVHSYVSGLNDESICTKSIGEDEDRKLYICKKSKSITIDIDGIYI